MPKMTKCSHCGGVDHLYKNNTKCPNFTFTPRSKRDYCISCNRTDHYRSNSNKCPNNKVSNFFNMFNSKI
jgi:hypothetical protein